MKNNDATSKFNIKETIINVQKYTNKKKQAF